MCRVLTKNSPNPSHQSESGSLSRPVVICESLFSGPPRLRRALLTLPLCIAFDRPSGTSSSSSAAFSASVYSAIGPTFEDKLPLLEELSIDTHQIWCKTTSILDPFRIDPVIQEEVDLSDPFLFVTTFGLFQLLARKLQFGIILGWLIVSSLFLYIVLNMLAGRNGNLDLYCCLSLVGYCMLPIVFFSASSLFIPEGNGMVFVMAVVFVLWSTRACTKLLVELTSCGVEHRGLIVYACFLVRQSFKFFLLQ